MRITFEIPDEEVHRVLAPLFAGTLAPTPDTSPGRVPAMMRIGEAAQHLDVSRASLYQLVARGEIPSVKIGRSIRIPAESLTTFLREEALRQKQEKERVSEPWRASSLPVAAPPTGATRPASAPPRVARPKPEKREIDLSPKPRPAESRGWTRDDHLGVLADMEKRGWPADLTALMLEDWDAGLHRNYVLRAADIAQLLQVSRSTAGAMIKRGQIPSFVPEPLHRDEKPVSLVSVLDYQRFVGNPPSGSAAKRV